jgi:hypothetical protein
MNLISLSLAGWNTAVFVAAIGLGLLASGSSDRWHVWHFTLGIVAALLTCLTHSMVMIHFMGSGKGIKEAVGQFNLPNDPKTGYVRRTKQFKARTSGLATLAAFVVIVTAWLGAARDTNWLDAAGTWRIVHPWFGYFAVLFNLYAFWVEYRVIKENTAMIGEINRLVGEAQSNGRGKTP